jgi:hypothetical protein
MVSAVAFTGNAVAALLRPDRPEEARLFGWLARDHPSGAMWFLLFGATLPALVMAWYRRRDAFPEESRRATLFIGALVLGFAPSMAYVLLTLLVPAVARLWDDPVLFAAIRWTIYLSLIAMPAVTAYAVRAQGVLDVRPVVGRAARRLLLPSTLAAATVIPLTALIVHLYVHRAVSLQAILSTHESRALLALSALSGTLLIVRGPVQKRLDRTLLRRHRDLQATLPRLAGQLYSAASAASATVIAERLEEELRDALNLDSVSLLAQQPGRDSYSPIRGWGRALPVKSALTVMARAAPGPLILDPEAPGTTFALLPEADRHWVVDGNVGVLVPVCDSYGRTPWIVALGRPPGGHPFSRQEQQFLEGVAHAGALALETSVFRAGLEAPLADESPAGQCRTCGRLHASAGGACGCGGPLAVAPLPLELNGKFRLIREAGRGGMGIVYQAEDLTLHRDVALKTLPRMAARHSARLRREARSMAALSHPHLALIFGAESWRGTPVLVMEYLAGGTLASRIEQRLLAPAEAIEICSKIADALAAMHGRGLVHRDVKPSNVGFSAEDSPKLLDFGLAYLLDEGLRSSSGPVVEPTPRHVPPINRVPGTALYLSPEALAGHPSTPFQDLWSLALVFYECLVGTEQLRVAVHRSRDRDAQDPFPGLESLSAAQPSSAHLVAYLAEALSRDLHRRPSTAKEFGDALRGLSGSGMELAVRTTLSGR